MLGLLRVDARGNALHLSCRALYAAVRVLLVGRAIRGDLGRFRSGNGLPRALVTVGASFCGESFVTMSSYRTVSKRYSGASGGGGGGGIWRYYTDDAAGLKM